MPEVEPYEEVSPKMANQEIVPVGWLPAPSISKGTRGSRQAHDNRVTELSVPRKSRRISVEERSALILDAAVAWRDLPSSLGP